MRIFTLNGVTIEVPKGTRSARAYRPEQRDAAGNVIVSGASQDFYVLSEIDAPKPDVQAIRWALSLPLIIEAIEPAAEAEPNEDVASAE